MYVVYNELSMDILSQSKKYYHDGKQLKLFCGCVNIEYIYSYTTKANGKIIETKAFLC